jgi:pimeloyl-ACP methyl ester carboxylesterase
VSSSSDGFSRLAVGEIDIAYEALGDPADPPVVLVHGLGAQLIDWPDGFCAKLVERGLCVIRFDNRDVGLSSHSEGPPGLSSHSEGPPPDLDAVRSGDTSTVLYTLDEMAADVAGLIEALGLRSAHVVGLSLGGMIAQTLAIGHPARVRSLTSIMSTTGNSEVGQSTQAALALLTTPAVPTRDGAMERAVLSSRTVGSPAYPADEAELRAEAARVFDRAFDPVGVAHQLAATFVQVDRTADLGRVNVPTLVIHGAEDPLIQISGGRATAAAIPGAELVVIEGMGHDLPQALYPEITDHIAELVRRAETKAISDRCGR